MSFCFQFLPSKPSLLLRTLSSSAPRSTVTTTPTVLQKHVNASTSTEKTRAVKAAPVVWSPTLETSTRTTKSIPQLNHLAGEDLTWPEIAASMGIYTGDCRSQWTRMYDDLRQLQPVSPDVFDHSVLRAAVIHPSTFERFWLRSPQRTALVQANNLDWNKIASEVFEGKFSPAFIRHEYITIARPLTYYSWRSWRKQRFVEYMAKLGYTLDIDNQPQDEPDWHQISEYVCVTTARPLECRRFWHMLLHKKHVVEREWTEDQVVQYWKTWLRVGKNWRQIANSLSDTTAGSLNIPPPTAAECREAFGEISLRIAKDRPDLHQEAGVTESAIKAMGRSPTDDDWTDEMHQELMRVVKEEQEAYCKKCPKARRPKVTSWETVAKRLNIPGVTAVRCRNRYFRKYRTVPDTPVDFMPRMRIMKEDMARLLDAVNERRPAVYKHWQQLRADVFPNFSVNSLKQTWYDHAIKELSRSRVLMSRLEKAVLDNGEHGWKEVSEDMSKDGAAFKSVLVCRKVWQTQVVDKSDPSWTEQETKELQEQVRHLIEHRQRAKERDVLEAPDWIKIGKMFSTKTSIQCKEKWVELGLLRQQELLREKMREMDRTITSALTINVEKVTEGFWSGDKSLFDRDSDTRTAALTAKEGAGAKNRASAKGTGPLALTPENLDKVWKQYRWTPERCILVKRFIDMYGPHPAVMNQVAEKLGSKPVGSAVHYGRLVSPSRKKKATTLDTNIESVMMSPSLDDRKARFLWSREYDQFLASRMALVGDEYKSSQAFKDVANVFGIPSLRARARWNYILKRLEEMKGQTQ
ncbi:hypothetical protein BGZ59_006021 [Podila verticillata]|nr:hypothetical protein BGZ59_006021 [Podila verticillata]KFH66627.1 hypothetical protein MVEG_07152 [Podila verticillata NRRL 6337]